MLAAALSCVNYSATTTLYTQIARQGVRFHSSSITQNTNNQHVRQRRSKARGGLRAHHHPSQGSKWRGDNVQGEKVDKDGQGFQVSSLDAPTSAMTRKNIVNLIAGYR